jgi:hypothetical protein
VAVRRNRLSGPTLLSVNFFATARSVAAERSVPDVPTEPENRLYVPMMSDSICSAIAMI